jgi:hypothetical protein
MTQPNITDDFAAIMKQPFHVLDVYKQLTQKENDLLKQIEEHFNKDIQTIHNARAAIKNHDHSTHSPLGDLRAQYSLIREDNLTRLTQQSVTVHSALHLLERFFVDVKKPSVGYSEKTASVKEGVTDPYLLLNPSEDMAEEVNKARGQIFNKSPRSSSPTPETVTIPNYD